MDLYNELRKAGYRVVQVYDGFYSDRDITEASRTILESVKDSYYYTYCKQYNESPRHAFGRPRDYSDVNDFI